MLRWRWQHEKEGRSAMGKRFWRRCGPAAGCLFLLLMLLAAACQTAGRPTTPPESPLTDGGRHEATQDGGPIGRNRPEKKAGDEAGAPPEPAVFRATLAAVGDVLLHRSILRDASKGDTFDFQKMFAPVKPYLERADITVANQESVMGGRALGLSGYPRFNSPYEIGDALKSAGVDVVVMANNHVLDRGEQGILNAIRRWEELGLEYVGAAKDAADGRRLRLVERNGVVFSFLAYTYGTNGIPVPEGKDHLVNLIDRERIREDVARARERSDVVVVSLHFGNEYERMPNDEQRSLVKFVADQGAHIILGHHPHVLQPVEFMTGAPGQEVFVAYSLGNFLAAQDHVWRQLGGILQLEVVKTVRGEAVDVRIHSPAFLPTYIYFKNWRGYAVLPLSEVTEDQLSGVRKYEEELRRHMGQYVPGLRWLSAESGL